jgi:AbrB family looped-hinge helix DNA binding protein
MAEIRVGRQGRIVIPSQIRKELGLEEGARLNPVVTADRAWADLDAGVEVRLIR